MSVEQPEAYNVRSQRVLLQIEVSGDAAAAAAIVVNCIDVNGDVSRARGETYSMQSCYDDAHEITRRWK